MNLNQNSSDTVYRRDLRVTSFRRSLENLENDLLHKAITP
jgi:hypothetical protein